MTAAAFMLVAALGMAGAQASIALGPLAERLVTADVVFLDTSDGDARAARAQRELLDAIGQRRGDISLVFGRLAREAQDPLDHFQMGHMNESEFLAAVGPWPNFERDYKAVIDAAVASEWFLVAGGPTQGDNDASGALAAETIAQAHAVGALGGKQPLVIVLDGGGPAIREQAGRRLPGRQIVTVAVAAPAAGGAEYVLVP